MNEPDRLGTVLTDPGGRVAVRFERTLRHPPTRVWEALTDPRQIQRWFTPVTLEPREGGAIHLDFGEEGEARGEILRWEPPRILEHTWVEAGKRSVVRWELETTEDGTRLVLLHSELDPDRTIEFGAGWQVFLDRLPVHLDGGDPEQVADRYRELQEHYREIVGHSAEGR